VPTSVLQGLAATHADYGHQVTVCTTDRSNPVQEQLPRALCTLAASAHSSQ